jgi:DNA helicase-2/ATP-dependent DNA helicase PcrA
MMAMKLAFSLTDEQQTVVQHDDVGAAVVHAVAGAGKTTAMVQRIARLVRERKFKAN